VARHSRRAKNVDEFTGARRPSPLDLSKTRSRFNLCPGIFVRKRRESVSPTRDGKKEMARMQLADARWTSGYFEILGDAAQSRQSRRSMRAE